MSDTPYIFAEQVRSFLRAYCRDLTKSYRFLGVITGNQKFEMFAEEAEDAMTVGLSLVDFPASTDEAPTIILTQEALIPLVDNLATLRPFLVAVTKALRAKADQSLGFDSLLLQSEVDGRLAGEVWGCCTRLHQALAPPAPLHIWARSILLLARTGVPNADRMLAIRRIIDVVRSRQGKRATVPELDQLWELVGGDNVPDIWAPPRVEESASD